jgi:O-antigen ligase
MISGSLNSQEREGVAPTLPLTEGPQARAWTPRRYLLALAALGVPVGTMVAVGFLLGQPWLGAIAAAVPIFVLILVKPEFGLFLIVIWYPFENFAEITPSFSFSKVLGIFTLAAVLVHVSRTGVAAFRISAFWLAVAFATWSGLTLFVGQYPELGTNAVLVRIQMVGLVFLVLTVCSTVEKAKTLYWVVFFGALIVSLVAFVRAPTNAGQDVGNMWRLTVSVNEQNRGSDGFAKALLPVFFLAPYLMGQVRRSYRPLILVVVAIVFVAEVSSGSRSCYAAAGVGILAATLAYRPLPVGRRIGLAVGIVTAIAAFIGVGAASGLWARGLWGRILRLWELGLADGGRDRIWAGGLQMGAENPLTGVGIGNYPIELLQRKGMLLMAHNDFITHFAETGIPGLLLYVAMLAAVLALVWKTREPLLRAGLIGLFVAAVVASMANPSFGDKGFWMQLSLCALGGVVSVVAPGSAPAPEPELGTDDRLAGSPG